MDYDFITGRRYIIAAGVTYVGRVTEIDADADGLWIVEAEGDTEEYISLADITDVREIT
jgi:hypothetical protein